MDSATLADLVVVVHLGYVAFLVLGLVAILVGSALRWRWARHRGFRIAHLIATLVVFVEAALGVLCPLTTWEHDLRRAAGQDPDEIGFVARLAREVLFVDWPSWVFPVLHVGFGLVVVLAFLVLPPRPRRRAGAVG